MWTILLYVNSISGKLILRTAASFAGIVGTLIQDREARGPERIQLWENIMAQEIKENKVTLKKIPS